jgi:ankyrin repeat protein
VVFEHEGWSPILWAACNGNEDIVRLLIQKNACAPYMNQNKQNEGTAENLDGEEPNAFVKQADPKKYGKYTPLHWASYKGYYKVVWLLLKMGMQPLDVD